LCLAAVTVWERVALDDSGQENGGNGQADQPVKNQVNPISGDGQRLPVLERIVQSSGAVLKCVTCLVPGANPTTPEFTTIHSYLFFDRNLSEIREEKISMYRYVDICNIDPLVRNLLYT
jgi:hypothetical protein